MVLGLLLDQSETILPKGCPEVYSHKRFKGSLIELKSQANRPPYISWFICTPYAYCQNYMELFVTTVPWRILNEGARSKRYSLVRSQHSRLSSHKKFSVLLCFLSAGNQQTLNIWLLIGNYERKGRKKLQSQN